MAVADRTTAIFDYLLLVRGNHHLNLCGIQYLSYGHYLFVDDKCGHGHNSVSHYLLQIGNVLDLDIKT